MFGDVPPFLDLDEAYWQSLMNDAEAQTSERPPGERRAAASMRPDDVDALWLAAQRAFESATQITVSAAGCNRGGLLIEWNGLRGFLPSSHICGLTPHQDEDTRRTELMQRVGRAYDVRVIEIERGQGRFVVSERLACAEPSRRDAMWDDLAHDQVRDGTVTNVCDFGVFVDLGGIEGLLHISEISWGRVNHPSDRLTLGQRVEVLILSVDRAQRRVALSMKRLSPDPWLTVGERYRVGEIVEGMVTSVVAFGAFARLADGLEGLIHVSELAEGNFLHPRNVVCEGQTVHVRVLNIDGAHRRLGLSLRQVNGAEVKTSHVLKASEA